MRESRRSPSMNEDALPEEFRMEVDRSDGVPTVRVFGELDLVNADAFETVLVDLAGGGGAARTVVADLSSLEFIDSTGLSALLVARHRIGLLGETLQIRGARGAAKRVFEAAGLEDVLDD